MAKEALFKIVEAEEKAESIVNSAREEAKTSVAQAVKRSDDIIQESIAKAKVECDKLKENAIAGVQDDLNAIKKASDDRCKSILEVSQEKFDEAKKILIERIVN